MMPRHTPSLLLLPGGLMAGHALTYSMLRVGGHGSGATLDRSMEALVCISVPLALASLVHAVIAGRRDTAAPIRFRSIALPQVALFLLVEILEHAGSGARPTALAALSLGVAAQVLAAAILCALAHGAMAVGRRVRGTQLPPLTVKTLPARCRPSVLGWSSPLPTPLRRRGPPASVT